jgi:hypothetical protein
LAAVESWRAAPAGGRQAVQFAPHGKKAQCRQHGQQQRRGEREVQVGAVGGAVAQDEVDTQAAVKPCNGHQQELADAAVVTPEAADHARVVVLEAEPVVRQPGAREVRGQEDGHAQPEQDPAGLERWHAQGAAGKQGRECQYDVDGQRAIEQRSARQAAPGGKEPLAARFRRRQGHQACRVVQQVGGDIREEDDAGREAQPATGDDERLRRCQERSSHPAWD